MKLTQENLKDLADGAAFLATGGGGDPYLGRLLAQHAVAEFGMPEVIPASALGDDDAVFTSAMFGAPTVLVEKVASGEDIDLSIRRRNHQAWFTRCHTLWIPEEPNNLQFQQCRNNGQQWVYEP